MGCPVVYFDIGCDDHEDTVRFYTELFGWNASSRGPSSTRLDTEAEGGIPGAITSLGHEPHQYVMVYVQVDDLDGYLMRAETLGGETVIPPTEVEDEGAFAWMRDPEGNLVGLWRPND